MYLKTEGRKSVRGILYRANTPINLVNLNPPEGAERGKRSMGERGRAGGGGGEIPVRTSPVKAIASLGVVCRRPYISVINGILL